MNRSLVISAIAIGIISAVIGVISYQMTLRAFPEAIMDRTMNRIAFPDGAEAWRHQGATTSKSRAVVRPSPDLLYSACVYDLDDGPVEITMTPSPIDAYWSLSLFDARTDNFFTVNDLDSGGKDIRVFVASSDEAAAQCDGPVIVSPTEHGIAIARRLAPSAADKSAVMAARQDDRCVQHLATTCQPTARK